MAYFQNFLTQYENIEELADSDDNMADTEQLLAQMEIQDKNCDQFFTEYGQINEA
jgi:hypothetical protein